MMEAIVAAGCCVLSAVLFAVLLAVIVVASRRMGRPPARLTATADALGLDEVSPGLWAGPVDGLQVAVRATRSRDIAATPTPSGLLPTLQLFVPVDRPPVQRECHTRRPWRGERDFDRAFAGLENGALSAQDKAALMSLLVDTGLAVELVDADRSTPVRAGLQAGVGLCISLLPGNLDADTVRALLPRLRAAADALAR